MLIKEQKYQLRIIIDKVYTPFWVIKDALLDLMDAVLVNVVFIHLWNYQYLQYLDDWPSI